MGKLVNIRADIPPEEKRRLGAYIESLVQEAVDEPVLRVVEHNTNTGQSTEVNDQFREAIEG